MKGMDFLSIGDLTSGEVLGLVRQAERMKAEGTPDLLAGKVIALLFEKPSLRTRVSFEVGIRQMGGIAYTSATRMSAWAFESLSPTLRACWIGGWTASSLESTPTAVWRFWRTTLRSPSSTPCPIWSTPVRPWATF